MQYFGGKAKIAKELSKELQSRLKEGQAFVDLFCGSCNVVSKIKAPVRIANDLHKELIALHKAVQEGWIPPSSISELEYKEIKNSNEVSA
jgi:site-specific DNA-adenine methylase